MKCFKDLLQISLLIFIVTFASACGPMKTAFFPSETLEVRSLAVLPVIRDASVPRERAATLERDVIAGLRNNGYLVLDADIIANICRSNGCPERSELAKLYNVDGFAIFSLKSTSQNNFLAGYYNSISGDLILTDTGDRPLTKVSHTERESGGLVVDSGQVITAVKSQIEDFDNAGFKGLSRKFAERLTDELLRKSDNEAGQAPAELPPPTISKVAVSPKGADVIELCITATPASLAYMIVPPFKSTLREVVSGQYCGQFRRGDLSTQRAAVARTIYVEVRSAFGSTARIEVAELSHALICPSILTASLQDDPVGTAVVTTCSFENQMQCGASSQCHPQKLFVYRAPSALGPYKKIGEVIDGSAWLDRSASKAPATAIYGVVALEPSGRISPPAIISASEIK